MRVWERGVGETRACGSGAVAVALAVWAGSEGAIQPLEVQMPGGSLVISPDRERGGIRVLGPATLGQAVELRLT
jgi:diaminopimelate epimerase